MAEGANPSTLFSQSHSLLMQNLSPEEQEQLWGRLREVSSEEWDTAPPDWQLEARNRGILSEETPETPEGVSDTTSSPSLGSLKGFSGKTSSSIKNLGLGGFFLALIILIIFFIQPAYKGAKQTRMEIVFGAIGGSEVIA